MTHHRMLGIRRRLLRRGLGLAGLSLLAGCGVPFPGQPGGRLPRVGGLVPFSLAERRLSTLFQEGLRERGYVVGEHLEVEYRSAEGQAERLPDLAAELVRLPVEVLVTFGATPAALAARQATTTIPIVALLVGDPIGAGLAASYARPGGNVTGITNFAPETSAKRLELLKELVPRLARVDFLWNPANPAALPDWRETEAAARELGVRARSVEAREVSEVAPDLASVAAERPDAVIVTGEVIFVQQQAEVLEFLVRNRLPSVHAYRADVEQGALLAYGVNNLDVYRSGADLVAKILRGAKPADLPFQRPTTFHLVVNLPTARALGLTIPQSILQQATEFIQ